jgi:hypothetical protein
VEEHEVVVFSEGLGDQHALHLVAHVNAVVQDHDQPAQSGQAEQQKKAQSDLQ